MARGRRKHRTTPNYSSKNYIYQDPLETNFLSQFHFVLALRLKVLTANNHNRSSNYLATALKAHYQMDIIPNRLHDRE